MKNFNSHFVKTIPAILIVLLTSLIGVVDAQQILPFENSNEAQRSQTITNPFKEFVPQQNVSAAKGSEIINEYTFSGGMVYNSNYENRTFDVLSIPKFSALSEPGKPSLPVHIDNVFIPGNARVSIEILEAETTTFPNFYIQPALTPAKDTEGDDERQFVMDHKVYNTDAFFPAKPVFIKSEQFLRGNKLASVAVVPVQFNPVTQTIKVYTRIKYKVNYSGGKSFNDLQQDNSDHYLKMFRNVALNSAQIPKASANTRTSNNNSDYIIITHNDYIGAADSLAKWKNMLGYSTEIISSSSWTAAMVKDSIHTRYQNSTPKPDYFVIIGDHGDVPAEIHQTPSGENFGTDLYYACMDGTGDYVPDMAHGRISVSSSTEALNVIQKIIDYEQNPVSDPSFYNKGTNCAYYQGYESGGHTYTSRRFVHTSEEIRSYLTGKGYNVDRIYTTDAGISPEYYQNGYYSDGQPIPSDLLKSNGFQWDGDRNDITNSINQGTFYVLHRDHGYSDAVGWAHPQFVNHSSYPDVQSLSNGNKTPVVFSINCHTGEFTKPEAFAETFLRHSNGGAVGVVAPSYFSYSGPNDGFAAGLFDAIWSSPGLIPNFGFGGVSNPSLSAHSDIYTMGDVVNQGLIRMVETWPGTVTQTQYTHELYHYFGDPAMRIFTASPAAITANIQDSIDGFSVQISNASYSNATATLYANGELLAKTVLTGGSGTITFADSLEGNAVVTLSGHNKVPHRETVYIDNLIKPNPPALQAKNIDFVNNSSTKSISLTVTWDAGDGDHRIVKVNNSDIFTDPVDGVEYTADSYFHNNGEQVVYVGDGSQVTVYNLDPNQVYWFRVYEYNNEGIYTKYTTTTESGNPKNQTDNGTFPVELISFDGHQNDKHVELTWSTASENNSDYFRVEKVSGEIANPIGQIPAAGYSNQILKYSFQDMQPSEGINYYRLEQVDFDGSSEKSKTIAVSYQKENELRIDRIQRVGDQLIFELAGEVTGDMHISLNAMDGRLIEKKIINSQNLKNHEISVSIADIKQSYYILRLVANNQSISKKVAIMQ